MDKKDEKTYLKYSPEVYKQKEPVISLHKFQISNTDRYIYTFVLNYECNSKNEKIALGTIEETKDFERKTIKIKEYMSEQIKQNATENREFYSLDALIKSIEIEKIPFEFTQEGQKVLLRNTPEERFLTKTYCILENQNGKADYLKMNFNEKNINSSAESIPNMKKSIGWSSRRKLLLKTKMLSPEDKELFVRGERIKRIVQEKNPDIITNEYRKEIIDYMMQNYPLYDESKETDNKCLAEKFIQIKEKGLVIDVKIIFEKARQAYIERYSKTGKENQRIFNTIQNYSSFFELLKEGRDYNARLVALKLFKIDFGVLEPYIEKNSAKDKELITYVNKKVRYIQDVQLINKITANEYNKFESVSDLYEFLVRSSTRKYTKDEEDKVLLQAFELMREDIISNNKEALQKYNRFAEKSGFSIELPEDRERIQRKIPQSIEKLYETEEIVK